MSRVLVYLPRKPQDSQMMWEELRKWQKASGLHWDKLRCAPLSLSDDDKEQKRHKSEIKAALQMLRNGAFDKVVFAELPQGYSHNLEWLLFALSCKAQGVELATYEGTLALPANAEKLAANSLGILSEKIPSESSPKRKQTQSRVVK